METLPYLDRRQSDGDIDIKTGVCPFINWSMSAMTALLCLIFEVPETLVTFERKASFFFKVATQATVASTLGVYLLNLNQFNFKYCVVCKCIANCCL